MQLDRIPKNSKWHYRNLMTHALVVFQFMSQASSSCNKQAGKFQYPPSRFWLFHHPAPSPLSIRPFLRSSPQNTHTCTAWRSWSACLRTLQSSGRPWPRRSTTTSSPTSATCARPARSKRAAAFLHPRFGYSQILADFIDDSVKNWVFPEAPLWVFPSI